MAATTMSEASILEAVYIPAEMRPKPAPEPARPVHKPAGLSDGQSAERFDFAKWSRENPVERMVDLDRGNKFYAPWRRESQPSVQYYPADGHWHDFGPDGRHGVDSFDLFCAMNDCWDEGTNRPDRAVALRLLGVKPGQVPADEAPSVPLPLDDHPPLPRAGTGPVHGLVQQELPVAEDDQWEEIE
jgi:hypothetical protein